MFTFFNVMTSGSFMKCLCAHLFQLCSRAGVMDLDGAGH